MEGANESQISLEETSSIKHRGVVRFPGVDLYSAGVNPLNR